MRESGLRKDDVDELRHDPPGGEGRVDRHLRGADAQVRAPHPPAALHERVPGSASAGSVPRRML